MEATHLLIPRWPTIPLALLITALPMIAAPVFTTAISGPNTPSTTTDETAFAADVSNSDLLHGIVGTGGTWLGNGSNPTGLNDGNPGGDYEGLGNSLTALNGAAWAADGNRVSFREFELGTGSGLGFDITGIQSIAAWQGAGFSNQKYEVRVRLVGETSFSSAALLTVDYQPFTASLTEGGSTKVNVTDDSGVLASGVEAIRFDVLDTTSNNGGGAVFREIDVFGAPTVGGPDETPPTLDTLNSVVPADGAPDVPVSSNLKATFSEPIALSGSGSITLKNRSGGADIPVSLPGDVSISGAVLTINPASNLASTTHYAVQIDTTAITDLSGNPFAGIANDTTWNFATASTPLRIMCLGDSITVGYTDNPGWTNHPFMFGYRSGLYTRLTNAGYNFQLVGGSTEPWTGISGDPTHGGTYTPALDLRDFGQDGHRGYGGAGIWGNVNGWIAADNPDVILLLIGINGIGTGSPAALNTLVNSIVTTAPEAHLIVAQITPRVSFNQNLYNYNVYIRDTLVPTYAGNGYKVTTVDLYSLFLTDPNDYSSAITPGVLANNINHPDNPHYDLMAQEWFEGIEALGLGPNNFSSWISDPAFGLDPAAQDFNDDPDGDNLANGLEALFGTHPGQFGAGLSGLSTDGTTTTFNHPQNASPPSDLSGFYQWSPNLIDWYASDGADGPVGGPTVTAVPSTVGITTTVTVTASEALDRIFVRAGVMQSAP